MFLFIKWPPQSVVYFSSLSYRGRPVSVVGIATGYGLGGPGIEFDE